MLPYLPSCWSVRAMLAATLSSVLCGVMALVRTHEYRTIPVIVTHSNLRQINIQCVPQKRDLFSRLILVG